MKRLRSLLLPLVIVACSSPNQPGRGKSAAPADPPRTVNLSIVGTSDLHGALDRLPILAGFVANLRQAKGRDGGVILVDAGDLFQGTIESNMNEGAAVVAAYNALGYAAAAIGNHEFDFGPAGEKTTPARPADDPRGALKARLGEANFPFLAANIVDADSGKKVAWPNAPASVIHRAAGIDVGIIGVTTEATPQTTMAANFAGLAISPLAETITREAQSLRARGAHLVVVAAHAGGNCKRFEDPDDLSSCLEDEEIVQVARALAPGLVDVIVSGHTHRGMAHRVNGIAIIGSYARGRAFGRVDVKVTIEAPRSADERPTASAEVTGIHPPRDLCPGPRRVAIDECEPGTYEGRPVVADPAIAEVVAGPLEAARKRRETPLGIALTTPIRRGYDRESALGNLFADLMLDLQPAADVAITNGGGLRADLPAGPLTYGALYEAMPFDNRFATVRLSGAEFKKLLSSNLQHKSGILLVSGIRANARCNGERLEIDIRREGGEPIGDDDKVVVTTNDFLATGDKGPFGLLSLPESAITIHDGKTIRDAMAAEIGKRKGPLSGEDPKLYNPKQPRIAYPGSRPVRCSNKR